MASNIIINKGVIGWFQDKMNLVHELWEIDQYWQIQEIKIKELINLK